ncbi:hypothetical protein LTR36_002427 [Oleoguttula mirabilis]|uniref:3-keto-steroid reductase n=1 Tax=Oleoguttula mirabilis TaxID=1507867 RepID=A0AAV9JKN3_9PEZI|nr:hypothetical protein LTR36_002427 [Oleoguttula mirabilis]
MDVPPHAPEEKTNFTVLVTGANSGLGFAICCRLIDEFLYTRPQSQTLHLLFSTRDTRKSENTLKRLDAHLQKTLREANGRTLGISLLLEARVKIEGVSVDLTKLLTVKALAKQLLRRGQRIDAAIWNAGISGFMGLNYPKAIWCLCTDLLQATTYPTFPIHSIGGVAQRQIPAQQGEKAGGSTIATQNGDEPKLGQIFLSNVFGHYMLTHWLAPLFTPASRIIWVSSISALPPTFSVNDVQGLQSPQPYEGSKRLTDLLVLNSEFPSAAPYVSTFLPADSSSRSGLSSETTVPRPKMYLTHPGIMGTSIAGIHWFLNIFTIAALYLARWLGSPWHPVSPYKGSISAVFAALAPASQLSDLEIREGKGKWGSATGVYGDERVARTDVEGWGFCGEVGKVPAGSVSGTAGRYRGYRATTRDMREQFEEDGRTVWREMEELRGEWEARLGAVESEESEDL